MQHIIRILFFGLVIALSSCNVLEQTSKFEFNSGFYKQRLLKKEKIYIDIQDEAIRIYPTTLFNSLLIIDTTKACKFYKNEMDGNCIYAETFVKPSLDLDIFTIPFKYRFKQNTVPPQLNTNLNGALYVGYRIDKYSLKYKINPKLKSDRVLNHFGISFGVFSGLGNSFISPTNTNNLLQQEYDALVWNKGLASIIAINKFTLGFVFGIDNLMDNNKGVWIYESKPWLGLAFGLNIN